MAIASHIKGMMETSSWIRKMFETGNQLRALHGADKVCDFSLGNPNIAPPPEFTTALKALINEEIPGKHAYMPNAGYPFVRARLAAELAAEQATPLGAEQVILTCGAGGALNVALKSILNPQDTVIASTPCFMEYKFYAANHGGELLLVPGKINFDLDVAALGKVIDNRTAAIIINSPNNPCGLIYPQSTLTQLVAMLERKSRETARSLYLISDEPYKKLVYDDNVVPPLMKLYRNTLLASSYSKELSIPGERIGYLAIHPDADDAANLTNAAVLCNRILGYVNAPALMQRAIERSLGARVNVALYQSKRDRLCEALQDMGYKFQRPQGTFYLFPKAPGGDGIAFTELLQEELILTVPGEGFGTPGHFRIAFCVDDAIIEKSLPGFERAINKIKS